MIVHSFHRGAVADGNGTAMDVTDPGVCVLISGITTATVTFYLSMDGSTWYEANAMNVGSGAIATSTAADGMFIVPAYNAAKLRCAISGYSAGTITIIGFGTVVPIYGGLVTLAAGAATIGALAAGENHLGEVGTSSIVVPVTPTITGGAYTVLDIVGGVQTIANAGRSAAKPTVLQSLVVTDLAGLTQTLTIWFFHTNPSNGTYTDNIALDIHDTDMGFCVGKVKVLASDYSSAADSSVAVVRNIGLLMVPAATSLFAIAQCTDTAPTYTSTSDLTFKYGFLRD